MADQAKEIFAIHGAGMTAAVWRDVAGNVKYPCHALTLPGHGAADEKPLASIEEMAAWVKTQLTGRLPQSVILMGHSMGALVALETADHPAVASLLLLGSAAKMPVHPDLLSQAGSDRDAAADMILKWSVSKAHPQAEAIKASLKQQMRGVMADALRHDLAACNAYWHGEAAASRVRQPVLVLAGQDDKMTKPAEGQALAERLQNGQCIVLPECGHMMMVEKAGIVTSEINGFLS